MTSQDNTIAWEQKRFSEPQFNITLLNQGPQNTDQWEKSNTNEPNNNLKQYMNTYTDHTNLNNLRETLIQNINVPINQQQQEEYRLRAENNHKLSQERKHNSQNRRIYKRKSRDSVYSDRPHSAKT